jgi:hypothetical protein
MAGVNSQKETWRYSRRISTLLSCVFNRREKSSILRMDVGRASTRDCWVENLGETFMRFSRGTGTVAPIKIGFSSSLPRNPTLCAEI